ncbi:plasmid stabilization protein [Marinitoga sp. 1197]|uniref:type II toxin-antitoxin system RelE/ParE family toxin n=1 Tax=Marinitoga sp. 1197 TaxID=1428449 RepID=UPI00065844EA|nr:type II toxin-antitoxin system RelE/ParE family toxin [Marinitoga sp. 1197]AJW76942.1 hypothetical protein UF08_53 [Marinitoga camini virus 1]KLO23991.1 plasmid stabilization protein [Marinitoga sp. 1197]
MEKDRFNEKFVCLSQENLKAEILSIEKHIPLFKNDIKKIKDKNILLRILWVMFEIEDDYTKGAMKKSDLRGIRTYKFYIDTIYYRLAYYAVEDKKDISIVFLSIEKREDIYDKLKIYFSKKKTLLKEIKKYGL